MSDVVVDSSVVAKWLLPEADSKQSQRSSRTLWGAMKNCWSWTAFVEAANAIWKQQRRGLITLADTTNSWPSCWLFPCKFIRQQLRCCNQRSRLPSSTTSPSTMRSSGCWPRTCSYRRHRRRAAAASRPRGFPQHCVVAELAVAYYQSHPPSMMKRICQLLLIATFVPLCWLVMQAVHELGHVVFAIATGGTVTRVVLYPLDDLTDGHLRQFTFSACRLGWTGNRRRGPLGAARQSKLQS